MARSGRRRRRRRRAPGARTDAFARRAATQPPPHTPQVSLTFDNKASHALNNEKAVLEELAKELCWTDRKSVASIRLFDQSSALNTESRGVFACFPTKYSVEKMLEWCNAGKYQREFYDELTE